MEWWQIFKAWFLELGPKYHVDPIIFGTIYVGAIPFFFASLYWTIQSIRHKKSIFVPVLTTSFFFVAAYLYLVIAGENIPIWVYVFIAAMVGYGTFSTIYKIKAKLKHNN